MSCALSNVFDTKQQIAAQVMCREVAASTREKENKFLCSYRVCRGLKGAHVFALATDVFHFFCFFIFASISEI